MDFDAGRLGAAKKKYAKTAKKNEKVVVSKSVDNAIFFGRHSLFT